MKRFGRRDFSQIMINNSLKKELDQLKKIIKQETKVKFDLSYNDVITFLKNYYYKPKQIEYTLDKKVRIAIPLQKVSPISVVEKLDGKTRIVNFLKS